MFSQRLRTGHLSVQKFFCLIIVPVAFSAVTALLWCGSVQADMPATVDAEKYFQKGNQYLNEQNYTEAFRWLKKAADLGYAEAQTNLGYLYGTGKGVKKNSSKAVTLYRKGCDGGYARGCSNLGVMYRDGLGAQKDYDQATALFTKSCDGGDARGCSNLGYMYYRGWSVQQDYGQALTLFRKGCDGGYAGGCNNLGAMYETGRGVVQDRPAAVNWYRKAAVLGDKGAQSKLQEMGLSWAEDAPEPVGSKKEQPFVLPEKTGQPPGDIGNPDDFGEL